MLTQTRIVDGAKLNFYSADNTYQAQVGMSGQTLVFAGTGTHVHVQQGHNLVFDGDAYIGTAGHALGFGESGDTINFNVSGVTYNFPSTLEVAIPAGLSSQYWRGDKTWQTLNQAAVAGLTTGDSPSFAGLTVNGNAALGSDGGGNRSVTLYTSTTGKNLAISTNTSSGLVAFSGGNITVSADGTASILGNTDVNFDTGGLFAWRDVDLPGTPNRMTLESATGNVWASGNLTLGANGGGAKTLTLQSGASGKSLAITTNADGTASITNSLAITLGTTGGSLIFAPANYCWFKSGGGHNMYFDTGGMFQWRDMDAPNYPDRMTLNSATGDVWASGNMTLGNDGGGAKTLWLYGPTTGKYGRIYTDASSIYLASTGNFNSTITSANHINLIASNSIYADLGGTLYIRDKDVSNAVRATFDSATGKLGVSGQITIQTPADDMTGGLRFAALTNDRMVIYPSGDLHMTMRMLQPNSTYAIVASTGAPELYLTATAAGLFTTDPKAPLHVVGDITTSGGLYTGGDVTTKGALRLDAAGVATLTQADVDNIRLNGSAISTTDAVGTLTIAPAASGAVIIDAGQGNQSEREILRLKTEQPWAFQQESTGTTAALRLRCAGQDKNFYIDTDGVFGLRSATGTQTKCFVDGSGRVTIGAPTAAATLYASGVISNQPTAIIQAHGSQSVDIAQWQRGDGANYTVLTKDGYWGLGVNQTPTARLHIQGTSNTGADLWSVPALIVDSSVSTSAAASAIIRLSRKGVYRWAHLQYATGDTVDWYVGHMYDSGRTCNAYGISTSHYKLDSAIYIDKTTRNVGINHTQDLVYPAQKLDINQGHMRFTTLAVPTAPTAVAGLAGVAGNVPNGTYYYKITYTTALGETAMGAASAPVVVDNREINLTWVPSGIAPSAYTNGVTGRKIYRTKGNDANYYYYVATLNNTTAVTYTDTTPDSALTVLGPMENTTGGYLYYNDTRAMFVGTQNLFLGNNAGIAQAAGTINNVFLGPGTGANATTGGSNAGVGAYTFSSLTTGASNNGMGYGAWSALTTGSDNVGIGNYSGRYVTTGYSNTFIGAGAGSSSYGYTTPATISKAIGIGASSVPTVSNTCLLGGINSYAVKVGVNVIVPSGQFHVRTAAAGNTGLIVEGWAGQSANLMEVRAGDTPGTVLFRIDKDGKLYGDGSNLSGVTPAGSYVRADADSTIADPYKLSFGSGTRQMLNLYGTTYGLGVQTSTAYVRTTDRFSIYAGGTHSNTENAPGSGGTALLTVKNTGDVFQFKGNQVWHAGVFPLDTATATLNNFLVGTGTAWTTTTPANARTALGLGSIATQNTNNLSASLLSMDVQSSAGKSLALGWYGNLSADDQGTTYVLNNATGFHNTYKFAATHANINACGLVLNGGTLNSVRVIAAPAGGATQDAAFTPVDVATFAYNAVDFGVDAVRVNNNQVWHAGNLRIGTEVQAYSAKLADLAVLAATGNNFIVGNGSTWVSTTPTSARAALGLGTLAAQNADAASVSSLTITSGAISTQPSYVAIQSGDNQLKWQDFDQFKTHIGTVGGSGGGDIVMIPTDYEADEDYPVRMFKIAEFNADTPGDQVRERCDVELSFAVPTLLGTQRGDVTIRLWLERRSLGDTPPEICNYEIHSTTDYDKTLALLGKCKIVVDQFTDVESTRGYEVWLVVSDVVRGFIRGAANNADGTQKPLTLEFDEFADPTFSGDLRIVVDTSDVTTYKPQLFLYKDNMVLGNQRVVSMDAGGNTIIPGTIQDDSGNVRLGTVTQGIWQGERIAAQYLDSSIISTGVESTWTRRQNFLGTIAVSNEVNLGGVNYQNDPPLILRPNYTNASVTTLVNGAIEFVQNTTTANNRLQQTVRWTPDGSNWEYIRKPIDTQQVATRSIMGEVYTGTLMYVPIMQDGLIRSIRVCLGGLPDGANLHVDVRRNANNAASSIIVDGAIVINGVNVTGYAAAQSLNGIYQTVATPGTASGGINRFANHVHAGDVLYIVVTQVGYTYSGSDLVVGVEIA